MLFSLLFICSGNYQLFANNKPDSLINSYSLKKADRSFESMAYVKAIDLYSDLVENGFVNTHILRNLAVSHYKIGETQKAEEVYQQVVARNDYVAEDIYYYAQSLKYNGNYEQADIWMNEYSKLNNNDSRVSRQINSKAKINELQSVLRYSIEEVSFNSKYSDFGPVLFENNLYFSSARVVGSLIDYKDVRKDVPYLNIFNIDLTEVSPRPELYSTKVNTNYHDGTMCFTKDGIGVYFTRNSSVLGLPKKGKEKVDNLKIYFSEVNDDGGLSKPVELAFNSNDYSCGHPSLSPDGKTLYFASNMPGGYGSSDIYYCKKLGEEWSEPVNIGPDINTEGEEMFPFIHESGQLYFASNGHLSIGGLDLFVALQLQEGAYKIKNMGIPLNSEKDDFSLYMKDDGSGGYFATNREGGAGDDDIYSFKVEKSITFELFFQGVVVDKVSWDRIEHPKIVLHDSVLNTHHVLTASENYDFSAEIDPDKKYILIVEKDGYYEAREAIIPGKIKVKNNTINFLVELKKIPDSITENELAIDSVESEKKIDLPIIYYDYAKWNIRKDAAIELNKVVEFMLDSTEIIIELYSYCDSRGSEVFNQKLSEKRSKSAANYLISKGIDKSRITAKGFGELKLKNHCEDETPCSEKEHQENRRTEVKIVSK